MASALADKEWDQSFSTILIQFSYQGLEKGGYVVAKNITMKGMRGFSHGEEFSPHITNQASNLIERKSWNYYISCSLDNNKQRVSEKISLTEKVIPWFTLFSLLPQIPWQHSVGEKKKELIPRSIQTLMIQIMDTS